jgi:antitoxin component YwqK of YwqJK toxin-antitoxin module
MAQINQYDSEDRHHGVWEGYYPDGTLWRRRHYHHGKLKGIDKFWNQQGEVKTKRYHLVIK